jgi:hypothetical protein
MRPYLAACCVALLLADPAMAQAIVPDPTRTPGAVRTTDVGDVCSTPTGGLRRRPREMDDKILAKYGLPTGPHPQVELDQLVPLCLGGAGSELNLWPEPRRSLEPEWNAERKDELEAKLCQLVCARELDVREAQGLIAEDWTAAYRRFFRQRWLVEP